MIHCPKAYKISGWMIFYLVLLCFVPITGQAGNPGNAIQSIVVVLDDNYPPYIFRNSEGQIQGILKDEWALWEKKTGVRVTLTAMDWGKAQEFMLKDQADVIDTIFFNEKRAQIYDFTKPYATIEVPVFFDKNIGGIVDIASLQGLTIGVKAGDACIDVLEKHGITSLQTFNSYEAIIQAAVDRRIKVFSIDKPPGLYYLYKMNVEKEFRYSLNLYTGEFHRAVKKGRTDVLKLVEDGFALISQKEHDAINKKWMGEPLVRPEYFYYVSFFLLFTGIIFLGLTGFNVLLRRQVRRKTSELQGAIQKLRLGEERYRILTEHSLQGIALLRGSPPVFVYVNPKWVEIFGYASDEALSMGPEEIWNLVHPDDREMVRQRNRDRLMGKPVTPMYEFRILRKDGAVRWVEVYANVIETGEEPSSQAVYVDITERKFAEAALVENNELLTLFIRHSPIYCYIKDVNEKRSLVLQASDNFHEMIGIPASEMIGRTMEDLFPPEFAAKITADDWDVVSKGDLLRLDEELNGKSYVTLKFPIVQGGKTLLAGYTIDITERKQAEADRLIAQKTADDHEKHALVGRIAGKMAHDFNNILGIVMGNTELALLHCQEPKTKKTLELIYNQSLRGRNLTKNLVAFAKDQEPKQEFFRLSEKIDLVLNLMRKDLEGIEVQKEASPGGPDLLADPGMIEHALVNLIQNSIHALSLAEHPRISVRTYSHGNYICFEIEDNGCGISKENLAYIYDPSFTLKGNRDVTGSYKTGIKGTGYGMSNVKKYIEQHKGSIVIESEPGSGTKFTVRLPVIKKELTPEEKTQIKKGKAYSGKYILMVEDETAIADIQYAVLTQEPCRHKVDIAANGEAALALLARNKYDLVSLDYALPGEMNGMDIYHHIRLSDKTVPILFISGNIEFLESIKELKQKDAKIDHLSKPCRNKDYIISINALFEKT